MPDSVKATDSWRTFDLLSEQVKEATRMGTFDARDDRYLAWSLLSLDQLGWEKVAVTAKALLAFVVEEQERAKERVAKSGETPVPITVALALFESPKDSVKAP